MFSILRKYNRNVIVAWLFSYVTVLMVPILISFVLYSFSYHQVKSETNRANELLLQQMEMSIDSKLKSLERLSLEIALNKGYRHFPAWSYHFVITSITMCSAYRKACELIKCKRFD